MNTTEHIVESYFRLVRGCLTMVDLKVQKGFGRQLDLLAFNVKTGDQYHVEISVKHDWSFNNTVDEMMTKVRRKFFGCEKGTLAPTHLNAIKRTYKSVGFDYQQVIRVWVPWIITENHTPATQADRAFRAVAKEYGVRRPKFELLLFRDSIIPELMASVGSCNYDDLILRTLSLLNIRERQCKKTKRTS